MKAIKTADDFSLLSDQDKSDVIDFFITRGQLRLKLADVFGHLSFYILMPTIGMFFYYSWVGYLPITVGCLLICIILRKYEWRENFQKMNETRKMLALRGIDITKSKLRALPKYAQYDELRASTLLFAISLMFAAFLSMVYFYSL